MPANDHRNSSASMYSSIKFPQEEFSPFCKFVWKLAPPFSNTLGNPWDLNGSFHDLLALTKEKRHYGGHPKFDSKFYCSKNISFIIKS